MNVTEAPRPIGRIPRHLVATARARDGCAWDGHTGDELCEMTPVPDEHPDDERSGAT